MLKFPYIFIGYRVDKPSRTAPGHSLEQEEEITCTKIYYASRTHSQLAQVLPELGKLRLKTPTSLVNHHPPQHSVPQKRSADRDLDGDREFALTLTTRAVSLGSRKQLCINDALRERSRDLDEACRELLGGVCPEYFDQTQSNHTFLEKEGKRCKFLPPIGEEEKMLDFRDQILVGGHGPFAQSLLITLNQQASPKDIEDLAIAGRLANTCPYFGSRRAIPQAEVGSRHILSKVYTYICLKIVTLPYNLLLQKSAREALGIDLKDQIVLIDEAHSRSYLLHSTFYYLVTV